MSKVIDFTINDEIVEVGVRGLEHLGGLDISEEEKKRIAFSVLQHVKIYLKGIEDMNNLVVEQLKDIVFNQMIETIQNNPHGTVSVRQHTENTWVVVHNYDDEILVNGLNEEQANTLAGIINGE
jgi:hypothetical protein